MTPTEDEGEVSSTSRPAREHPSLTRIASFSDGVFAFAITLLILAVRIPHPSDSDAGAGLLTLLSQQWRTYLAYVLSFILVGINWANHRVMFSKFARATNTLVWLNLLYLMVGVAFVPIPTAVLGAWLGSSHANQVVAAMFYGIAATVGALLFVTVWWYGAYHAKVTNPALTASRRRAHTLAWTPAPLVTVTLTLVALASPLLAICGFVLVIFTYVLPLPRFVALKPIRYAQASDPAEEEVSPT